MSIRIDRRKHERFHVAPMYSRVSVRLLDDTEFRYEGHCYDIGEGGIRFDLDRPIAPGTTVAIRIDLPIDDEGMPQSAGHGRAIFAIGNVVWLDDSELPADCRMAVAFTRFGHTGDRSRLLDRFSRRQLARAA